MKGEIKLSFTIHRYETTGAIKFSPVSNRRWRLGADVKRSYRHV